MEAKDQNSESAKFADDMMNELQKKSEESKVQGWGKLVSLSDSCKDIPLQ